MNEVVAGFNCPLCGRDSPHEHSRLEVAVEHGARPDFERYFAETLNYGMPRKWVDANFKTHYSVPAMEGSFVTWVHGWLVAKGYGQDLADYFSSGDTTPAMPRIPGLSG